MNFSIKDFFSKCDQIHRNLRICESLMENFIFCTYWTLFKAPIVILSCEE